MTSSHTNHLLQHTNICAPDNGGKPSDAYLPVRSARSSEVIFENPVLLPGSHRPWLADNFHGFLLSSS